MEAVQKLPPHQQQAFMKEMESMQLKDSLSYVAACGAVAMRRLAAADDQIDVSVTRFGNAVFF